ncbi:MAG: thermonuclease family protein [bacterium]|nr:thermonuclease family protein [bacterium]
MNKYLKIFLLVLGALFFFGLGAASTSKNISVSPRPSPAPAVESASTQGSQDAPNSPLVESHKVQRVIDGDTIELFDGRKVRLIGIDTPELNKSGSSGCFGREAYDYADKLLTGQMVKLEKDISETDRYGRLLRFVYLDDAFINDKLVRDGYARVYTYPPDVKYQDKFKESEKYARDSNLGLWSKCNATVLRSTVAPVSNSSGISGNSDSQNTSGNFSCDCSKSCSKISSCEEAQFQLKTCGCTKRDGDGDGLACDGAPLNCQN